MSRLSRTPSEAVRRALRQEVGFGCPIPGCGNPYLTWHHFDPPWHDRQHHDLGGMVALCREHHGQADAGAFTKDQLRGFKQASRTQGKEVGARFNWLRNNLLIVQANSLFYQQGTSFFIEFNGKNVVWFNRDENGYWLLNVDMPESSARKPRAIIRDNFWVMRGNPVDVECPPSGKRVKISYDDGDMLSVTYLVLDSLAAFERRYVDVVPSVRPMEITLPATAMEVHVKVGSTEFGPRIARFGGARISHISFEVPAPTPQRDTAGARPAAHTPCRRS